MFPGRGSGAGQGVERCLKDSGPGPVADEGLGGRHGLKMADMRNKRGKGKTVERNTSVFGSSDRKAHSNQLKYWKPYVESGRGDNHV